MISSDPRDMDFIEELRLRRWARQNYVPPCDRHDSWHPVILEELRSIDIERSEHAANRPLLPRYVPLPPTEIMLVDAAHQQPGEPYLLRNPARLSASPEEMLYT